MRNISAQLSGNALDNLEIKIADLRLQDKRFENLMLVCTQFKIDGQFIRCNKGEFLKPFRIPLSFDYNSLHKTIQINFYPLEKEIWRAKLEFNPSPQIFIDIVNGEAKRLSDWLPDDMPKPTKGILNGQFNIMGQPGQQLFNGNLQLSNVDFSDPAGLRASQNLTAIIQISGKQQTNHWQWQGNLDWQKGEVFWQPLYFPSGGHALGMQGEWNEQGLQINKGKLRLLDIGEVEISGFWDKKAGIKDFDLNSSRLKLAQTYQLLLKPFLENTTFSDMRVQGTGNLMWHYQNGETKDFKLIFENASLQDSQDRFSLNDVKVLIPWQRGVKRNAEIQIGSGSFRKLPLGKTNVSFSIHDSEIKLPYAVIPILDGKFSLRDFHAALVDNEWQWKFRGELSPVNMGQLTKAFDLPEMHGDFSAVIPKVSYEESTINVDGALLFKIFDGNVIINNLKIIEPVGRTPILSGDLDAQRLDLDLLTRTFSFGNIQGRIDAKVTGLEMINWQPQQFNAWLASSPGSYPKNISQRAVENISSLGGGGTAALQASFLRFFEHFGYQKMGLSCVLRKGVCKMDGIETIPNGYIIVKGGGIPAINVIGYNREVGWVELLERLKRVTTENLKPVVK